jgi:heme-degrading monooxygenase HmoA
LPACNQVRIVKGILPHGFIRGAAVYVSSTRRALTQRNQPQEELMKPVTQINFLSIKPEKIDEFIEVDQSYLLSGNRPKGLTGSRLYKSADGKSVVRVSQYESVEAQNEILQSGSLRQHIDKLRPLVESSNPCFYEEVYTTGDFK